MFKPFDDAAEFYDEVRPGYPDLLYHDIIGTSHISEGCLILEIGCGTGQATLPLARRGFHIVCVEQGANLIKIAEKKCQGLEVSFINDSFESWEPSKNVFDLVISATAFHWIKPEIGLPKVWKVLKKDGYIALFWNLHPPPFTGFFDEVQEVYKSILPEWFLHEEKKSLENKVDEIIENMKESNLFEEISCAEYTWSKVYSAENYLKLLDTFSDHRQLDAHRKNALYDNIRRLINEKYHGCIIRPYLTRLVMAKKKNEKTRFEILSHPHDR